MKTSMKRWPIVIALISAVMVSIAGCSSKDLVTLAGLDKEDLYIGDRFGNKVKIDEPESFLEAFRTAKSVKEPQDLKSETQSDYVFYSGNKKVYYDASGKYLSIVEKGKKRVYSADLGSLLDSLDKWPPSISAGFDDDELAGWLGELSHVESPTAILFDRGDKNVLAVLGGKRSSGGYSIELEKLMVRPDSGTEVIVRLVEPKEATDEVSFPYAGFTISDEEDLSVIMIIPGSTGEDAIHVPLARAEKDQNIILLWPERGAILTERVKMKGFTRVFEANFLIEVEDGHNVLGIQQATASKAAPDWGYFEFWMDLDAATSPFGTIIGVTYSAKDGSRVEEVKMPVSFGGK